MATTVGEPTVRVYRAVVEGDTGDDGPGVTTAQIEQTTGLPAPSVNMCLEELAGKILVRLDHGDTPDQLRAWPYWRADPYDGPTAPS